MKLLFRALSAFGLFASASLLSGEMEVPDGLLAAQSDYCVIASGTGTGLEEQALVFGNPGWRKIWIGQGPRLPLGSRAIVYLSQGYDNVGANALRQINGGHVEVVSLDDWPPEFRRNLNLPPVAAERVPTKLRDYIIAVQIIAARTRVERLARARASLDQIYVRPGHNESEDYQRINSAAEVLVQNLHADDESTLAQMSKIVLNGTEPPFQHARGTLAGFIAFKYYRPGFDAVRAVAFHNQEDTWDSEGTALEALTRIGDENDLRRMKAEIESIVEAGVYRQILDTLFKDMGHLTAHLYPRHSAKRAKWCSWFERICTAPTPKEKALGCAIRALWPLGDVGSDDTRAVLIALKSKAKPEYRSHFDFVIRNLDAQLAAHD